MPRRIRTFIAVELSPNVKSRAAKLIDDLRGADADVNWVQAQQMHLTLKFLGDVPDTETPDVCRVVEKVAAAHEPFEIMFRGLGAFPNAQHPRTLWIALADGGQELKSLQAAIDEALKTELGYAKEQRGFHPHLTIGRVKHEPPGGELERLIEQHAEFEADLAVVDEVVTFASFPGPKGPTHDAMSRAELGGRPPRRSTS
jgi:2'-5' RNA ligase